MTLTQVILFGLGMNFSAGLGAVSLAWCDDYFGSKKTILLSLSCLIVFGIPLLLVKSSMYFWIFALSLSLFLGPVQAASRSLMARISPKEKSTEMFGIYAFSGKITAFAGSWLLGATTLYFGQPTCRHCDYLAFFYCWRNFNVFCT